ncbi:MAG: sigma-70 family RNA polymerase sigma factor [Phycisphaerales bacterium]|nr:sigma-70 family RNA polymerase sigma factor [Phycisphaerales bacterium]
MGDALPKTTTVLLEHLHNEANIDTWHEFIRRYQPVLVGFGCKLGLSEADASDAAQWTLAEFLIAYRAGKYVRGRGRLSSWVIGIARHRIESLRRDGARHAGWHGDSHMLDLRDSASMTQIWEREQRQVILNEALRRLRESSRFAEHTVRAFELVALRGMTPEAAALECSMTVDDVYLARHRVTGKLREWVARVSTEFEVEDS